MALFLANAVEPGTERSVWFWANKKIATVLDGQNELPEGWALRDKPLVRIQSFVLMDNHYHLLLEQRAKQGITRFMQRFGASYPRYFNERYDRRGRLFERRFSAVPVSDDRQLRYVIGYIHLNPLDRKGLEWREVALDSWEQARPVLEEYPWSSYHYYTKSGDRPFKALIEPGVVGEIFDTPASFCDHLAEWEYTSPAKMDLPE